MTEPTLTAQRDTPRLHPRWGGVAEELLHHTSRYYAYAEAYLRGTAGDDRFTLVGYRAESLEPGIRRSMVAMMLEPPGAIAAHHL